MNPLYTVGLEGTTRRRFMSRLVDAGISSVVDVRLRPEAPCDTFAETADLPGLLMRDAGARYERCRLLAPTAELVDGYLAERTLRWSDYAESYLALLDRRQVERALREFGLVERCALLCTEAEPWHCHRRLAAEYLISHRGIGAVSHL